MKLRIGDRLLLLLEALLLLALVACVVLDFCGISVLTMLADGVYAAAGQLWGAVILIGIAAIVALLGVYVLMVSFRHEKKKFLPSFVMVEYGEKGQVKISISAIRQMVEQAICRFDGVSQMRIEVKTTEDSITVDVDAVIASGVHVPTVTLNMQRAIREYVEENCGIAVRSVDVTVNSVDVLPEAARPVLKEDAPAAIAEPVVEEPSAAEPAVTESFAEQTEQEVPAEVPAAEEAAEPAAVESGEEA